MSKILENLKESTAIFQKISEKANLLKQLNVIRMKDGIIELDKGVTFETVYSNGFNVTIAKYPKMGCKTPSHCHGNIVEYLICTKGSFSISFANHFRVVKVKDCVSIPESINHCTTALEDNSELVAICVPAELVYTASMKKE